MPVRPSLDNCFGAVLARPTCRYQRLWSPMMKHRIHSLAVTIAVATLLAGCEAAKSSNPTSPSVAGPIPGVTINTPKLLEPANNWTIQSTAQPITLLIENASSNGQRAVSYLFEIATDVQFSSRIFTRDGVAPGENGRTSLRLP